MKADVLYDSIDIIKRKTEASSAEQNLSQKTVETGSITF